MKIGLLSDIKHAGRREELGLWAIQKVLRERGILAVVMQEPQTSGVLSEFAVDQFTICAAQKEELRNFGVYHQIRGYVTEDASLYHALKEEKEKGGKVLLKLEHPMFLVNQMKFHAISEKPEETQPFFFVDLQDWSEENIAWLRNRKEQGTVQKVIVVDHENLSEELTIQENWERVNAITPEQYLGYVWMSAAVITDTYVGTALAALHEKPFVVLSPGEERSDEIREILSVLCLSDHFITDKVSSEWKGEISDTQEFRAAIHRFRDKQFQELEQQLHLEEADMVVKCPVKLPVSLCSGCGACEAACPENAIHMEEDKKGFFYPVADMEKCTDCDWCIRSCIKKMNMPFVNYRSPELPEIYAASAPLQENQYTPYSGLFQELVHFVRQERDGVIFGTVLNDKMEPEITWTEDEKETLAFAEQRFLTPHTQKAFRKIKELLIEGRFVLFTGISCQCAGLRGYLNHSYPKLLICELMCHGTVSEKLFHQYTDFLSEQQESEIKSLHFGNYPAASRVESRVLKSEYANGTTVMRKFTASPYYRMVEREIPVRESCTNCVYTGKKKVGDLTLGELKKVHNTELPKKWREESLLIVNTEKGKRVLNQISAEWKLERMDYDSMFLFQYRKPAVLSKERTDLFKRLDKVSLRDILKSY